MKYCFFSILLLASWCDKVLEGFGDDGFAFYFRRVTTFINFAFSPLTCILAALTLSETKTEQTRYSLGPPRNRQYRPLHRLAFLSCWFSASPRAMFIRAGYLFLYPFAVNAFYASVVVFYSTKQVDKPNLKLETIAVFVLFGSIFGRHYPVGVETSLPHLVDYDFCDGLLLCDSLAMAM
jgi:hypothetical protein